MCTRDGLCGDQKQTGWGLTAWCLVFLPRCLHVQQPHLQAPGRLRGPPHSTLVALGGDGMEDLGR